MTLKNNMAPFLSNINLYASFHHHMWIQTGVTVRKRLGWVMTSVTLTFDLWPCPFTWTSLLSLVITPEISWWYDDGNIVKKVWRTARKTDRRTDWSIHRAAWSQLKIENFNIRFCGNGKAITAIPLFSLPEQISEITMIIAYGPQFRRNPE